MRNFLRLLSTSAVLWTEMEKASDLLRSDTAFANALEPGATSPIVLQLGGSDPHELGASLHARALALLHGVVLGPRLLEPLSSVPLAPHGVSLELLCPRL